jgi:alanyl-tRNA synthetase
MGEIPQYWKDPGVDKFEVLIESVTKHNDYYHVVIREKVIRPAGGGQAGERGRIIEGKKRVAILDTISDSNNVVLITNEALTEGARGLLEIDMNWRTSMMKNHTAEHLFVSIIKNQHEDISVGELWIDGEHGTVELLGVALNLDTIIEVEREVMRIIEQDLPVKSDYRDSSTIDSSVRSREGLTEKYDHLRIVSVGELDSSACSGIHVTRTGDIGFFKVLDAKTTEKNAHIEFVTGSKARRMVSNLYNVVLRKKYTYPFEIEQLDAVLDRAKADVDDKQKLIQKTTQLLANGSTSEQIADIRFMYENLPGYDASSLKSLANQIVVTSSAVILLFAPGKKSQVILRVNEMPKEASEYISKTLVKLGGRGGGQGEVFTGGFADVENPMKLYEELVCEIRKSITQSQ